MKTTKEIAREVRSFVKNSWKGCKLSIRTKFDVMEVALLNAPFNPFSDMDKTGRVYKICDLNLDNDKKDLSEEGYRFFSDILGIIKKYHREDMDAYHDCYSTNFYLFVSIGSEEMDFAQV